MMTSIVKSPLYSWRDGEGIRQVAGIYQITNISNGKIYIGSAMNLHKRKKDHFNALQRGDHFNNHLQNAWYKYGSDVFAFNVVEFVTKHECLVVREQYWIDFTACCDKNKGYNLSPTAGSSLGVKHTDETKQKYRLAKTGRKFPATQIRNMSIAKQGIKNYMYNRKHTPEARAKIKSMLVDRHPWLGKHHSETTKKKMSNSAKERWRQEREKQLKANPQRLLFNLYD